MRDCELQFSNLYLKNHCLKKNSQTIIRISPQLVCTTGKMGFITPFSVQEKEAYLAAATEKAEAAKELSAA